MSGCEWMEAWRTREWAESWWEQRLKGLVLRERRGSLRSGACRLPSAFWAVISPTCFSIRERRATTHTHTQVHTHTHARTPPARVYVCVSVFLRVCVPISPPIFLCKKIFFFHLQNEQIKWKVLIICLKASSPKSGLDEFECVSYKGLAQLPWSWIFKMNISRRLCANKTYVLISFFFFFAFFLLVVFSYLGGFIYMWVLSLSRAVWGVSPVISGSLYLLDALPLLCILLYKCYCDISIITAHTHTHTHERAHAHQHSSLTTSSVVQSKTLRVQRLRLNVEQPQQQNTCRLR